MVGGVDGGVVLVLMVLVVMVVMVVVMVVVERKLGKSLLS